MHYLGFLHIVIMLDALIDTTHICNAQLLLSDNLFTLLFIYPLENEALHLKGLSCQYIQIHLVHLKRVV